MCGADVLTSTVIPLCFSLALLLAFRAHVLQHTVAAGKIYIKGCVRAVVERAEKDTILIFAVILALSTLPASFTQDFHTNEGKTRQCSNFCLLDDPNRLGLYARVTDK